MAKKVSKKNSKIDDIRLLNVETAVNLMTSENSKMLQVHVFEDKEKKKSIFSAFFILGENGEPEQATKVMNLLKRKFINSANPIEVESIGDVEISFLVQHVDNNGAIDLTRPCKTPSEFIGTLKQYGISKLVKGQRLVKRFDFPVSIKSLGHE